MPQKHDNCTRKVFDGIGEGGGWGRRVKAITRTASAVKNRFKCFLIIPRQFDFRKPLIIFETGATIVTSCYIVEL
jgi:hypothetical protein